MAQMLTANRLIDGTVVYWRSGQWVEAMGEGDVFADESAGKAALAAAQPFVTGNVVVNPYLFDMKGNRPLKEREIIRALGPSIHDDLGKQAEGLTPAFAQRSAPPKPVKERDDDVSI